MNLDNINLIEASSNYNHVFTNVTDAQKLALQNLEIGETVYQTDGDVGLYVYTGTIWIKVGDKTILEYDNFATFPQNGKKEIIYIAKNELTPYYYDGSNYVSLIKKSIDNLKDGVDAAGNTLKKLFDLVSNRVIKNADIVAGTGFKISYDAKGLVTASATLESSDIPNLDASKITSGTMDVNRLPSNIVTTDANGNLPSTLIPSVTLTDTKTPSDTASMLSDTTSPTGTVSIVTNDPDPTKNGSYVKNASGEWVKLSVPTDPVTFINGKNGVIAKILAEDIGGVFENDANKTLLTSKLPLFDGDVSSTTAARNTLTLKTIAGLTEGEYYSSIKVNNKGLVVSGKLGESYTKTETDNKFLTLSEAGHRNVAEGFVGLNTSNKIDSKFLPAITLNTIYTVATIAQRDALTVKNGDTVIVTDVSKTFIVSSTSPTVWTELLNPLGGVTSINGNTGTVVLDLSNIPGTLAVEKLPKYLTGDVITNVSNELTINPIVGLTSGTYSKLTVNTKGQVTSGTNITASDIPDLSWNKITTDKPNFAILDTDNKIPYVNLNRDIIEVDTTLPASGDINKIYVKKSDNTLYRYSGTAFVKVGGQDLPTFSGDISSNGSTLSIDAIKGIPVSSTYSSALLPNNNSLLIVNNGQLTYAELSDLNVIKLNSAGKIDTNILPKTYDIESSRILTINGLNVTYKDNDKASQSLTTVEKTSSIALTKDSKQIQIIKASEFNTVIILPDARSLSIGGLQYIIKNEGLFTLRIVDNDTNWICDIDPNASISLLLADNSNAAGHWVSIIGKASDENALPFNDPQILMSNVSVVASTPLNDSIIFGYVKNNSLYVNEYNNGLKTPLLINTVTSNTINIAKISNNQVLISYITATGLNVSLLTISTTISKDDTKLIDATAVDYNLISQNGYGIVSYVSTTIKSTILTIAANVITINTVLDTTLNGENLVLAPSFNDKFILAYTNTTNKLALCILSKSNNTLSNGAEILFDSSINNLNVFNTHHFFNHIRLSVINNFIMCAYHYNNKVEMVGIVHELHNNVDTILFDDPFKVSVAKINGLALSTLSNSGLLCSILNKNGLVSSYEILFKNTNLSLNNIKHHSKTNNGVGISNGIVNHKPYCLYMGLDDNLELV